jgi:hypothetical protein
LLIVDYCKFIRAKPTLCFIKRIADKGREEDYYLTVVGSDHNDFTISPKSTKLV